MNRSILTIKRTESFCIQDAKGKVAEHPSYFIMLEKLNAISSGDSPRLTPNEVIIPAPATVINLRTVTEPQEVIEVKQSTCRCTIM